MRHCKMLPAVPKHQARAKGHRAWLEVGLDASVGPPPGDGQL